MVNGTELIIGAVLPPFIDLINRKVEHSRVRYAISLVVCVIVGFGISFWENKLSTGDILGSIATVFLASQTVYKTYYNKSGVRTKINSILEPQESS